MPILPRILIIISFLALTVSCISFSEPEINVQSGDTTYTGTTEEIPQNLFFGIPADSFNLVSGRIKRNGLLSQILSAYGITNQEIDLLLRNSSDVFDVRKIRAGKNYFLLCNNDSIGKARYLIYEHDPTISYIFSFNDSLNITPFRKEIKKVIKYSAGTIQTSLWEAMVEDSLNPMLAVGLSEIYAWTVDFFGLQKGDRFKVIYDELYIDDSSQGIGRIYGAEFTWAGKTTTAIPFIQNGTESYYDASGNSLRKAFLKAPLQFSRISSRFSSSRLHPILRIRRPHFGVDYAAPIGTPVHAVGDGRVTAATTESGSGRIVRIVHNSVYSTAYMHLSRFGPGIVPGAFVKQGDIIGFVGSSGLSTGPHLDFRFYKNGSPVDPLKVEAPPVEPVLEENIARFEINRKVVESLLETF